MTRTDSMRGGGYADLVVVVALVVATTAALLSPGVPQAIEWVLAVPFLLVIPGYVLVATLFPAGPGSNRISTDSSATPGWIVRLALVFVGSVLVLAVVGVALSLLGRLSLVPVVLAIDAAVGVGTVTTWFRRRGVTVDARADPIGSGTRGVSHRLGLSMGQTLALAVSILALVGAVAFVGATPAPTDSYSEVSLLEDDGTLLGVNGTATLEAGAENPLTLRVENHEGSETTYEIVGQLQRVGPNGSVLETWEIDRDAVTVPDGERVDVESGIDPPTTADRLRLHYLVYTGSVPDQPSVGNADLAVRQWVEVVPEGSA